MKLSKRVKYGLRVMIDLSAHNSGAGVVQIKEIAERAHIPSLFLEQILLALKNAGLLQSKMGVGGGYYLAKSPDQITLGRIVRILDEPLAPIRCVSQLAYEPCGCPDEQTHGLHLLMGLMVVIIILLSIRTIILSLT